MEGIPELIVAPWTHATLLDRRYIVCSVFVSTCEEFEGIYTYMSGTVPAFLKPEDCHGGETTSVITQSGPSWFARQSFDAWLQSILNLWSRTWYHFIFDSSIQLSSMNKWQTNRRHLAGIDISFLLALRSKQNLSRWQAVTATRLRLQSCFRLSPSSWNEFFRADCRSSVL